MNATDIVIKTPEGVQELKTRSHKLPPRLRAMLIMIDGSMNCSQLQAAAGKLGVSGDFLDNLQSEGLVATKPSAKLAGSAAGQASESSEVDRFRAAQKFMNDTVVDALGFRAFFFTLKLEKCTTRPELAALLDDHTKAIIKGSGDDIARVLRSRLRELLA